jgi:energy-coupling factor transporter transmembrane protein EcfT
MSLYQFPVSDVLSLLQARSFLCLPFILSIDPILIIYSFWVTTIGYKITKISTRFHLHYVIWMVPGFTYLMCISLLTGAERIYVYNCCVHGPDFYHSLLSIYYFCIQDNEISSKFSLRYVIICSRKISIQMQKNDSSHKHSLRVEQLLDESPHVVFTKEKWN